MHFRIFDCWRLAAALLIMAYHFLFAAPAGAEGARGVLFHLLALLDMFFMISGFLIATRYSGAVTSWSAYGLFLRRRIARLYPLHLLTLAFFAVLAVAAGLSGAEHYPWREELAALPQTVLALHALGMTKDLALNYASWSVSAEFFSYALFPLLVVVRARFGIAGLAVLATAWIACLEIASAKGLFPQSHWLLLDTFGAYRGLADFMIGALVASLVAKRPIEVTSHLWGLSCLALAVASMLLGWSGYASLAFFALALFFTALAETRRPDSTAWLSPLMPLARVSFGIYLWHPVMEAIFLNIAWARYIEPSGRLSFYLYWLLPMAATIVVALVSERWFERPVGAMIAQSGAGARAKVAAA